METRHSLGSLLPLFVCGCVIGLARPAAAASRAPEPRELSPMPRTPPPLREPTAEAFPMREVLKACSAELSILCRATPSSVSGARACLEQRVQVVRKACRKVLGLKKS